MFTCEIDHAITEIADVFLKNAMLEASQSHAHNADGHSNHKLTTWETENILALKRKPRS